MNHKKHGTRQRLWFLAGFAAAAFLVHKANLTTPETRGAYEDDPSMWPKNKGSGGNWNTDNTSHDLIHGEGLVLLRVLVPQWLSDLSDSQPVGEVSSVGQSCGQADDSDSLGSVRGDEVGPGHNDLQHWTPVLTWRQTQWHSPIKYDQILVSGRQSHS